MATYNGAKYLEEQLDSFFAQSRLPDELIITDDCSQDNTIEIIKRFAEKAPFEVKWAQNERNLGYTGNFNKALMKTTGDLVFLSDQDDVWYSNKLERMEEYALQGPEALVIMNDAALTDDRLNDTKLTKLGQIRSAGLSRSSFTMGCCVAVRRELLDLCLPIPSEYRGHDGWIVKIAEGVGRRRVVADVLQWYRRHETNESQFVANRITKITRLTILMQAIERHMTSGEYDEKYQEKILQTRKLLMGVRDAEMRASSPLSERLRDFSGELERALRRLEERMCLRSKPHIQRLLGVISYWYKGGYKEVSGLKSALRDLVIHSPWK